MSHRSGRRKRYARKACVSCCVAKRSCNDHRPCDRCVRLGKVCEDDVSTGQSPAAARSDEGMEKFSMVDILLAAHQHQQDADPSFYDAPHADRADTHTHTHAHAHTHAARAAHMHEEFEKDDEHAQWMRPPDTFYSGPPWARGSSDTVLVRDRGCVEEESPMSHAPAPPRAHASGMAMTGVASGAARHAYLDAVGAVTSRRDRTLSVDSGRSTDVLPPRADMSLHAHGRGVTGGWHTVVDTLPLPSAPPALPSRDAPVPPALAPLLVEDGPSLAEFIASARDTIRDVAGDRRDASVEARLWASGALQAHSVLHHARALLEREMMAAAQQLARAPPPLPAAWAERVQILDAAHAQVWLQERAAWDAVQAFMSEARAESAQARTEDASVASLGRGRNSGDSLAVSSTAEL